MELKCAKVFVASKKKDNNTNLHYFENLRTHALISSSITKRIIKKSMTTKIIEEIKKNKKY